MSEKFTDLLATLSAAQGSGPCWSCESDDLDVTFLSWAPGEGVVEHVNEELDVFMVGIQGEGTVTLENDSIALGPSSVLLIPKGARRSVLAGPSGFAHLNIHRRRRRLMPDLSGSAWTRRTTPK